MEITFLTLIFSIFTNTQTGQGLVINEILFNPKKDGADFVELYNPSGHAVDLQHIYIANVNAAGEYANMQRVSATSQSMMPGTYRVLTTNPATVAAHYPKARLQNFIRMARLPNFNNDRGYVILLRAINGSAGDPQFQLMDSLFYTAAMHSPYIKDPKGISLERQSQVTGTNEPGNFRSAAVAEGGATPGYQNSNIYEGQTKMRLNSRIISPDQDGVGDQLELHYNIVQSGLMATVQVFNMDGRLIRNILRNISIPSQGVWVWDGLDDRMAAVPTGIYTLVIELYNASGYHQVFRKSFVLALRN